MIVQLSLFDNEESKKINHSKFKDKCDICGKFDYLQGYNGICVCPKCKEMTMIGGEKYEIYKSRVCGKCSK